MPTQRCPAFSVQERFGMSGSTSSFGGLPPEARTALERLASSDPTAVADLNLALAPYTLLPQGGGTAARELAARVDAPAVNTFTSLLLPANNSGVLGAARAVFDEAAGTVTVDFRATGLTPGQEHTLHIHGFSDDRPSLIPNAVLDADRDGFIEDHEGEEVVGPVILALTADGTVSDATAVGNFPVADASGALALSATYQFNLSDPGELVRYTDLRDRFTGRELQIHGRDVPAGAGAGTPNEVDGTAGYKAVLPVGNGILLPVVQGDPGDAAVLALVERLLGGSTAQGGAAGGTTTDAGTTGAGPGGEGTAAGMDVATMTPGASDDFIL
jgi:hypothetical protein